MELPAPFNENSFGDQLGWELKCSELSEGEKVEMIKISLIMKSGGMFVTPAPKTGNCSTCGSGT